MNAVFFGEFDDECSCDAGKAAAVIGRVMESIVDDDKDVGGRRLADAVFVIEIERIVEAALPRVVEGEEVFSVRGGFHSREK